MGTIVRFPEAQRQQATGRYVSSDSESANVIILPVVRIDRDPDKPFDGFDGGSAGSPGRRRRRRASRS